MLLKLDAACAARARGMHRGFTLVELVVVIALLGILAVGSVSFLQFTVDGYGSSGIRAELAATAATASARIAAELEDALPNSLRQSGSCIEFVPVVQVSRYVDLPQVSASGSMRIEAINGSTAAPARARIAVNPDAASRIYDSSAGVMSVPARFSAPRTTGVITATFASPQRFANESPQRRVFLVGTPVSYCVVDGRLYRYASYGVFAAQPAVAELPSSMPQRALLADHVDARTSFNHSGASLQRNAVVSLHLQLVAGDERLEVVRFMHQRHVP